MKLISLFVNEYQKQKLENLVELKFYPNVAEAIRCSINDLLDLHQKHLTKNSKIFNE